ncbi:nitroreductase family protein [Algibacter sp. Ld11]|uniref:nitroreductase family protein n=1 Tax=Algibacter sp. Ld11 TaxID=649150 RepID=UPI003864E867
MKNKLKFIKNVVFPSLFTSTGFLSSLYYLLFSSTFRREHQAVLVGKVNHLKELNKNKASIFTLIRNTHRIEKGLLMRPRREIFALNFISETIDVFEKVWEKDKMQTNNQFKWFHDVLQSYFELAGKHPIIDEQAKKFYKVIHQESIKNNSGKESIPYFREDSKKPNISYEDFYKLTKYRRSVRWFLNKKVPHELVDKAILAANQSPSACNRQPFEYRIIDDPELLKTIVGLPMGVKGYSDGIPMLIVAVGNLDAYFYEGDRHVIYIDASLANMTLIFALETLGLGSCAINWPDVEHLEQKMAKFLNLKKHQRAIMCLAVGYPDPEGKVAYSEKKSLDYIRKYN